MVNCGAVMYKGGYGLCISGKCPWMSTHNQWVSQTAKGPQGQGRQTRGDYLHFLNNSCVYILLLF